ncbi:MAG: LamG-like jellyroll fold domain-containing protein, partial [Pirellulales bacterium]
LSDSAEARRVYLGYELLRACLEMEMSGGGASAAQPSRRFREWLAAGKEGIRSVMVSSMAISLLVAGLTITTILLSLALITPSNKARPQLGLDAREVRRDYVARIAGDAGCQWEGDSTREEPLTAGADLYAGERIVLQSGCAEIAFDDGARVWIEGPTVLVLDQSDACLLEVGRLSADVSQRAVGFTVHTAAAEMVDQGTQFAVFAEANGRAELHVLKGQVLARPPRGEAKSKFEFVLNDGESMSFGVGQPPSRLVDAKLDLAQPLFAFTAPPQDDRWREAVQPWLADPHLIAAWLCESQDARRHRLANRAESDAENKFAADSIAASWRIGRWSTKPALSFGGQGKPDRVEIANSRGEPFHLNGSFTLSAWFRTSQLTTEWQAIVTKGDTAWRLHRHGSDDVLAFGTNDGDSANDLRGSTAIVDGQWHHAVCVFEVEGEKVVKRLYLDGRLDASAEHPIFELARNESPVWIGNNFERPDRTFNGLIDEVLL